MKASTQPLVFIPSIDIYLYLTILGYDSLVIEVAWRHRNGFVVDSDTQEIFDEMPRTDDVIVLEGLYMLDKKAENLDSVYWKDESLPLCRGTWFQADTMQPLPMDLAETIEKHHITKFRDQSIPDGPVFSDTESSKRPGMQEIYLPRKIYVNIFKF